MPKITDFDFPEPAPPKPGTVPAVVERLQARAAAEDAKPAASPEERAKANLVARLADTHDPDEVRSIASALAALDKIAPEPDEAREELDLSGMSDQCLEELVLAGKIAKLPAAERDAYRVRNEAKALADELQRMNERQELYALRAHAKVWMCGARPAIVSRYGSAPGPRNEISPPYVRET